MYTHTHTHTHTNTHTYTHILVYKYIYISFCRHIYNVHNCYLIIKLNVLEYVMLTKLQSIVNF